jgi:hypothetical protein
MTRDPRGWGSGVPSVPGGWGCRWCVTRSTRVAEARADVKPPVGTVAFLLPAELRVGPDRCPSGHLLSMLGVGAESTGSSSRLGW